MRVIKGLDFLKLPSGTIFCDYEPHVVIGGWSVKGDSLGENDFYRAELDLPIDTADSNEWIRHMDMAVGSPEYDAPFGVVGSRDAMYDVADRMFLVLTTEDVEKLREVLLQANLNVIGHQRSLKREQR